MGKNLIPEVAKLLGLETGEKFMIRQNKYIFEDSIFISFGYILKSETALSYGHYAK